MSWGGVNGILRTCYHGRDAARSPQEVSSEGIACPSPTLATLPACWVPEKAVPVLERAARLAPEDLKVWRLLAEARADAGQWSAAEAAWARGASLSPDDRGMQLGRARALIQLGRPVEAEPLLREALKQ